MTPILEHANSKMPLLKTEALPGRLLLMLFVPTFTI
jgi:hypothetical protein